MSWLTLILAILLLAVSMVCLACLRRPTYRVERTQVLRLFDQLNAGQLSHREWLVFTAMPIRHDPWLDAFRQRCAKVEDAHLLGDHSRQLFDARGREKLALLRKELQDSLNQGADPKDD